MKHKKLVALCVTLLVVAVAGCGWHTRWRKLPEMFQMDIQAETGFVNGTSWYSYSADGQDTQYIIDTCGVGSDAFEGLASILDEVSCRKALFSKRNLHTLVGEPSVSITYCRGERCIWLSFNGRYLDVSKSEDSVGKLYKVKPESGRALSAYITGNGYHLQTYLNEMKEASLPAKNYLQKHSSEEILSDFVCAAYIPDGFSTVCELSSDELLRFGVLVSAQGGMEWYDQTTNQYVIPLADFQELLDTYFESCRFDPASLTRYANYEEANAVLVAKVLGFSTGSAEYTLISAEELDTETVQVVMEDSATGNLVTATAKVSENGVRFLSCIKETTQQDQSETAILTIDPQLRQLFRSVLRNETSFTFVSSQQTMTLQDFGKKDLMTSFTVIDLEGDDVPELIVQEDGPYFFKILRYDGEQLFCYDVPYRGMMDLKTDRTYCFSSGHQDHGIGRAVFTDSAMETNKLIWCQSVPTANDVFPTKCEWFAYGEPATEAELSKAYDARAYIDDVRWYDYDDETIGRLFGTVENAVQVPDGEKLTWPGAEIANKIRYQQVFFSNSIAGLTSDTEAGPIFQVLDLKNNQILAEYALPGPNGGRKVYLHAEKENSWELTYSDGQQGWLITVDDTWHFSREPYQYPEFPVKSWLMGESVVIKVEDSIYIDGQVVLQGDMVVEQPEACPGGEAYSVVSVLDDHRLLISRGNALIATAYGIYDHLSGEFSIFAEGEPVLRVINQDYGVVYTALTNPHDFGLVDFATGTVTPFVGESADQMTYAGWSYFNHNMSRLAVGSYFENWVRVFDVFSGECVYEWENTGEGTVEAWPVGNNGLILLANEELWAVDLAVPAEEPSKEEERSLYVDFESSPESWAEYAVSEHEVSSPQEAVEFLFNEFLKTLMAEDSNRSFCITEILAVSCELYDREYIQEHPNNDWGYAANNAGCFLGGNQWLTWCCAEVKYTGSLGLNLDIGQGSDWVRWGNLRRENGQYIFLPTEMAVHASDYYQKIKQYDEVRYERYPDGRISERFALVREGDYWGLANGNLEIILEPERYALDTIRLNTYEEVWPILAVQKDGYWGAIDYYGNLVIEPKWQYMQMFIYEEPKQVFVHDGERWWAIPLSYTAYTDVYTYEGLTAGEPTADWSVSNGLKAEIEAIGNDLKSSIED